MGKIGEEITQKIKSAVKAKLIELGVEIDNELPDYIMVLVANKKSQESMIKDLQLFLGSNTVIFTAWLHNVLKKLEQVTVSSRGIWKNNNYTPSSDSSQVENVKSETSIDSPMTYVVKKEQELESDTECLEISATGALYEGVEEVDHDKRENQTKNVQKYIQDRQKTVPNEKTEAPPSRSIVYNSSVDTTDDRENRRENESSNVGNKSTRMSIVQKEDNMNGDRRKFVSAVRSVALANRDSSRGGGSGDSKERSKYNDRRLREDAENDRRLREDTENVRRSREDAENERRTKLKRGSDRMSKVLDARDILRKRAGDASYQKSKAVKSQLGEKKRKLLPSVAKPIERRTPVESTLEPRIPSLVKVTPRPVRRDGVQPNKKLLLKAVADAEKSVASVTISQKKRELFNQEEVEEEGGMKSPPVSYIPPEKIFITLTNQDFSQPMGNSRGLLRECTTKEPVKEPIHIYEQSYYDNYETNYETESQPLSSPFLESENWKPTNLMNVQNIIRMDDDSPKCIITLGNSSPEKSDEWDDDMTEMIDVNQKQTFEWNRLGPPPVAAVKPSNTSFLVTNETIKTESINKALQRCKFWPNCLDKACIFYHPSSPCKLFPLCKYGNQCLFIHPDCKYGANCLNFSCNYLHRNPLKDVSQLSQAVSAKVCSFFPNCSNPLCKFRHPVKICRFGKACARSDCFYFHPKKVIPPKELLSWKAK